MSVEPSPVSGYSDRLFKHWLGRRGPIESYNIELQIVIHRDRIHQLTATVAARGRLARPN